MLNNVRLPYVYIGHVTLHTDATAGKVSRPCMRHTRITMAHYAYHH